VWGTVSSDTALKNGDECQNWSLTYGLQRKTPATTFVLMSQNEGQGSLTFPFINPSSYLFETTEVLNLG